EMCERYLKSHVFVSPSSIESQSNSIGEAIILGVPVVSSDVGGIRSNWNNELIHNENGYVYPADAPYMLAYYIMNLFNNDELAQKFSHNARPKAIKFYDKEVNFKSLVDEYNKIAEEN
ncbi:MAG: glycosyltransferase family 4 protein, partial [Synergistaceae bacterium]|nr:glycosyltransferase family 4 protein [Synergistaceae bacterium]